MGLQGLWYVGGMSREGMEGKWHGDDIIFPNIDICLIMLAVWFNESLLKKIGTPGAIFLFLNSLIMPPYFHDHSSIFHDTLLQN